MIRLFGGRFAPICGFWQKTDRKAWTVSVFFDMIEAAEGSAACKDNGKDATLLLCPGTNNPFFTTFIPWG